MKKYVYYLLACIALASCGSGSDKGGDKKTAGSEVAAGNTPGQQQGIQHVKGYFGGYCKVSTGVETVKMHDVKYIKIEESGSGSLDSNMSITELNVGNMAMMFFSDLGNEVDQYDELVAVILFGDGQTVERKYRMSTLKMVSKKTKVVLDIVGVLKDKKYDLLNNMLTDSGQVVKYNKKALIEKVRNADPELGEIKSFMLYGFLFFKSDTKKDVLHISGMIIRDKQRNEFSVDIDTLDASDRALFINYKL